MINVCVVAHVSPSFSVVLFSVLGRQEVKGRMAQNALASGSVGEDRKLRVEDLMQFFK